jgi:hypothetical protein
LRNIFIDLQKYKPQARSRLASNGMIKLKICPVSMLDGSARRFAITASSSSKALEVQELI